MPILLVVTLLGAALVTALTAAPIAVQMRGHPRGLYVLFATEMWERFSYYGLRALLILYLTQHFLLDDGVAAGVYGGFTTLVFLSPLVGGVLADRVLGQRRAIVFGALLLVAGHGLMALDGRPSVQALVYGGASYTISAGHGEQPPSVRIGGAEHAMTFRPDGGLRLAGGSASTALPAVIPRSAFQIKVARRDGLALARLYVALAMVAMGVGFLKPNVSALVGRLYAPGDPRREAGFTLYYYGINVGSFWAALVCAAVGETIGWWAGFGLAAVGMSLGLVTFLLGRRWVVVAPAAESDGAPAPRRGGRLASAAVYLGVLVCLPALSLMLGSVPLTGALLGAGALAVFTYLGRYAVVRCTRAERWKLAQALGLLAGAVVFFTLLEQAGSSLTLFAARNVAMPRVSLPGGSSFTPTPGMAQAFGPGFILILAPILSALWTKLERSGRDPGAGVKFGLGLVQVGLGFLLVAAAAGSHDAAFRLSLWVLAGLYLLHSMGELFVSPVGMAEMTRLSPPLLVSTLMAVWFLATAAAQFLGGFVARAAGTATLAGAAVNPAVALATSTGVFSRLGLAGVAAGMLFIFASAGFSLYTRLSRRTPAGYASV